MLVLSRRKDEGLVFDVSNTRFSVVVTEIHGGSKVRIGILAGPEVIVTRSELLPAGPEAPPPPTGYAIRLRLGDTLITLPGYYTTMRAATEVMGRYVDDLRDCANPFVIATASSDRGCPSCAARETEQVAAGREMGVPAVAGKGE